MKLLHCTLLMLLFLCAAFAQPRVAGAQSLLPDVEIDDIEASQQQTLPLESDVPDDAIEQRLRGVFSRVDAFRGIEVDVQEGVVYLSGTVERAEAREKAEAFAGRLEGTLLVANNVKVSLDVDSRINPAVDRITGLVASLLQYLPLLTVALVLVLLFYGLAKLLTFSERPFQLLRLHPLVAELLRRLVFFLIFIVGIFIAIDLLDITALVGAAVGTAGVVGIALGFAFRDTAENYLAGVLMSLRRPFNVNDLLKVGEHEGLVVRLTLRELVLLTVDGNHVRLPNAMVFKSVIYNFTANPRRQFQIEVGLDVSVDLVEAQHVGVEAIQSVQGVLADPPPFARVHRLGDSNVVVNFFGWVDQRETGFFKARSEAIRILKQTFDGRGINMPLPQYQVSLVRPDRQRAERKMKEATVAAPSEDTDRAASEEAVVEDQVNADRVNDDERNLLEDGTKG